MSHKKNIMIVDDDRLISAVLQANFKQKGYNILAVHSAVGASIAMRRCLPDLIILDVILPGTNGLDFCGILRTNQDTGHLPILMISSTDVGEQSLQAGADAFLLKPFDISIMLATVAELLQPNRPSLKHRA